MTSQLLEIQRETSLMLRKSLAAIALFILFFAPSASSQETLVDQVDKVFLDTLVALAKRNYPRMRYYEAKTMASKSNVKAQKYSWFNPLSFSYQYLPNNNVNPVNPVFLNGYQFGLFLNIGALLQTPSLIKKAKQEYNASKSEEDEYNLNITAEVQKRYFYYLLQLNMLRVLTKTVLDSKAIIEDISIRYQKSEVPFEEYSKALIVFNGNVQSKLEAETNMLTAKSAIEELIGVSFDEIKPNGSR